MNTSGTAPKRGGESANRRFQFQKRSQLFIRPHNVMLSVAAMCISNPDRSRVAIDGWDAAPTPTGFDGLYRPLAAALSPSLIASASLTYLPFLVVP